MNFDGKTIQTPDFFKNRFQTNKFQQIAFSLSFVG